MGNNRKKTAGRPANTPKPNIIKYRFGNFFVKDKGESIEVRDLFDNWYMRVEAMTPCGINLRILCRDSTEIAEVYVKLLWAITNAPIDQKYLEDLWSAYSSLLSRQPKEQGAESEEKEMEIVATDIRMESMSEDEIAANNALLEKELEKVEKEIEQIEKENTNQSEITSSE